MTSFEEFGRLYDEWIKEFDEKSYPEAEKEVKNITHAFMARLREIDREQMKRTGALGLTGTIAFSSLTMLSGALIAKYTLSFGERSNEPLLKQFNDEVEKWYKRGLEQQEGKSLFKVPNIVSNPPFY